MLTPATMTILPFGVVVTSRPMSYRLPGPVSCRAHSSEPMAAA
jgi:hypothetical protein